MEEMRKEQLDIIYDGELLREGLMDVRDLAPALLSFGELCQGSNRVLNGDKARVSVHVKAGIERGSFELGIVLDQSLLRQAFDLFRSTTTIFTPGEIVTILFSGGGLVPFLRWAMGRRIEEATPREDNKVELTVEGDTFIANQNVYNLILDEGVRKALHKTLWPLEKEGIDSLEVRREQVTLERIVKEETKYFAPPESEEDEELEPQTMDVALTIYSPVFDPSSTTWRFYLGDEVIRVDMGETTIPQDTINRGSVNIADVYKVKLQMTQRRTPTGRFKSDYKIIELLEFMPGPEQHKLPIEPPSPDTEDS